MEYLSRVGGQTGEAALAEFIAARGPMAPQEAVTEEEIKDLLGKVPNLMIDIWRHYGSGALEDRRFWIAPPGFLDDVLSRMFANDPDFEDDVSGIAYGATGNVLAWSKRHGPVFLVLQGGSVQAPGLLQPNERLPPDEELLKYLTQLHPFFFDAIDGNNEPILEKIRELHPPLGVGEVFGTYPISTGFGNVTPEGAVRMPVTSYLMEVMMSVGFMLRNYEGDDFNVRPIGRQP